MRRNDPLQRAGTTAGKGAQAHSRKLSSVDRLLGKGPIENAGPNRVRVGSEKIPLLASRPTSATTLATSYTTIAWVNFPLDDSGDAVWTSTSQATIATMGFYELKLILSMGMAASGNQFVKWQKNGADLGPVHDAGGVSGTGFQIEALEPWVRLNPGDVISAQVLSASASNEWKESRCSIRLVKELLGDKMLIKATGATVPYSGNADEVWLTRDAASSAIAGTLTSVATITGLPVGTYQYEYFGTYQTTATTTGAGWAWAFATGTATGSGQVEVATTGGAAATHAASGAAADATGNLLEAQAGRTNGGLIGAVTVSVDLADTNLEVLVKGKLFVTVAGDFSIQQRAELALSCTARPGSLLILRRLS